VRRIVAHDASVRRGEWNRAGGLTPWDLHGATVGLVGYGEIGRAVARRLRGFDVRLLICDPALDAADGTPTRSLPDVLAEADVVSLHVPLTDGTRGLIGPAELAAMRSSAILVNTSRGALVDEAALADALAGARLRAAALDVFADEPRIPDALRRAPNLLLSPHVSGLSVGSIAAMTEAATGHVLAALRGEPDATAVANPDVLAAEVPA
jgi:phosphoglycerate dehydrogenase-like enzyme